MKNWVISRLLGYKQILFLLSAICLLSVKIIDEVEFGTLYKIGQNDRFCLQGDLNFAEEVSLSFLFSRSNYYNKIS